MTVEEQNAEPEMAASKGFGSSTAPLTRRAKAIERADFIKRFFAVAVSVGFASKIVRFDFLSAGQFPSYDELHQLLLLIFAMGVIVGSWEFYFPTIANLPLIDWQRFAVDMIIVSLYMILLSSNQHVGVFFLCLTAIMLLYVVWDTLSMRAYPAHYNIDRFTPRNVVKVYAVGIASPEGRRGHGRLEPFISLWWFVVFAAISYAALGEGVWFYPALGVSGIAYVAYRRDQDVQWSLRRRLIYSGLLVLVLYVLKFIH
jgi:hypothetical protein